MKIDDVELKDGGGGDTGDEVDFSASEMHGPTKLAFASSTEIVYPGPFSSQQSVHTVGKEA